MLLSDTGAGHELCTPPRSARGRGSQETVVSRNHRCPAPHTTLGCSLLSAKPSGVDMDGDGDVNVAVGHDLALTLLASPLGGMTRHPIKLGVILVDLGGL